MYRGYYDFVHSFFSPLSFLVVFGLDLDIYMYVHGRDQSLDWNEGSASDGGTEQNGQGGRDAWHGKG